MTHLFIENRDGHCYCHRTKFVVYDGVIQEKTHDGQTTWIIQRNNKKNLFFQNELKINLKKCFFYSERAFYFEQTLNTIIERTIL